MLETICIQNNNPAVQTDKLFLAEEYLWSRICFAWRNIISLWPWLKVYTVHIIFSGPWIDLIPKEAGVVSMLNTIFTTCHVTGHEKTFKIFLQIIVGFDQV